MLASLILTWATAAPFLVGFGHTYPLGAPQALSHAVSEYPDPIHCKGNCSWIHDPTILYEDGLYWRFSTSGNIAIALAPRLDGPWTYQGPLLHQGTKIHIRDDQDIWAPHVTKHDGTYYCHYSVSYIGSQHSEIGVATSQTLQSGSWFDHGAIGLPQNSRYNLIDPYVYQDDPENPTYLTFGSFWSGIQQIRLQDDHQLLGWTGTDSDIVTIVSNTSVNAAVVEGAIMHKHDGKHYIFFSVGQCCRSEYELAPPGDEYHIVVCRADHAEGPFKDAEGKSCLTENGGTTILASHGDIYAPGGQGIMIDPDNGRTIMYYHYIRRSHGYSAESFYFGFNYLEWTEDGWPVVAE